MWEHDDVGSFPLGDWGRHGSYLVVVVETNMVVLTMKCNRPSILYRTRWIDVVLESSTPQLIEVLCTRQGKFEPLTFKRCCIIWPFNLITLMGATKCEMGLKSYKYVQGRRIERGMIIWREVRGTITNLLI